MVAQIVEQNSINRIFPWLKELSSDQLTEFYADFFSVLEQALQDKEWSILEETVASWQATAEVLADTELTTLLTEPADDDLEDWDDVEARLFDKTS